MLYDASFKFNGLTHNPDLTSVFFRLRQTWYNSYMQILYFGDWP